MSDRTRWTPEVVRKRIQVSMIIMRLEKHIVGKLDLSPTQIMAAKILLAKVIPDLRAIEHSGELTHSHVAELSDAVLTNIAAGRIPRVIEAPSGSEELGEVH